MSYDKSAPYYDAIYTAMKGYESEAARVWRLAESFGHLPDDICPKLLDVACGTGLHDQYLVHWFDVVGIDLSPEMLATARRRLPHLPLVLGDMRDCTLSQQFDVVTCLFSAIGHLGSVEDLRQTIANFARHLRPGGVCIDLRAHDE